MKKLTVVQLLRIAGMLAWLMYPIAIIAMLVNRPEIVDMPQLPEESLLDKDVVGLVALLFFGVCYWINMRDIPVHTPTIRHYVLLTVQLVAGLLVSMLIGDAGLLYVLAAEIPLVLGRSQAIKWVAVQVLVTLPWTWLIHEMGHFEVLQAYQTLSTPLLIGLVALNVIVWQLFAFAVGWLAANEARDRRELARLNMELLAARNSLDEQSRLEERLHISRELHDVMGHHLMALNLQLELARRTAPEGKDALIATASKIARDLLAEARKIVSVMRMEPAGNLVRYLQALKSKIPLPVINLDIESRIEIPKEVQHVFLRCVQEGVSNTLRHSNASAIWIELKSSDGGLHLSIRDNGSGYAATPEGNGLTGMRERVERLAGTMLLSGCQPHGYRIDINVPRRMEK